MDVVTGRRRTTICYTAVRYNIYLIDIIVVMMILVVTDIHGNIRKARRILEEYGEKYFKYMLVNGDITHFGDYRDALNIMSTLTTIAEESFFVPGNCDPRNLLEVEELATAKNIHGKTVNLDKFKLHGLGGSNRTPFHTYIEFDEDEIRRILDWNLEGSFILMSHVPPKDTKLDRLFTGGHAGSIIVRDFIIMKKPMLAIHGHIHEARGIDKLGDTIIVNPGPFRSGYYATIEFKNDEPEIGLHKLI